MEFLFCIRATLEQRDNHILQMTMMMRSAQSGRFTASPPFLSVPSISKRRLHLSGDGNLRLWQRAHLKARRLLGGLTDHLQGRSSTWHIVTVGFLVRAGVLFVGRAAAQLGSALSPTGELTQGVPWLRVERDELWLDGGRVDPLVVKEVLDPFGHLHVRRGVVALDVSRGDDAAAGQLPDVQLVDGEHPLQTQQPLVEPVHVDLLGHGLQQDEGRLLEERVSSVQQDAHHDDAEHGIQVEDPAGASSLHGAQRVIEMPVRVVDTWVVTLRIIFAGLPHKYEYYSINHHDDRAQGVAQHVQEDAAHVQRWSDVVHVLKVGVAIHLHLCVVFTADFCR